LHFDFEFVIVKLLLQEFTMSQCQECGKEFFGSRVTQKYCSQECRAARWHRANPKNEKLKWTVKCAYCESEFTTSDGRKKFCSAKCNIDAQNAKRPTIKEEFRTCPVCNTQFQPLQKRGVGRLCCSDACTIEHRHGKAVADKFREKKQAEYQRKYGTKYRLENAEKLRNLDLKKNYGITLEDYKRMHEAQNGVCAICNEPEKIMTRTGKVRDLAVDHDHSTGKVRQLLCTRCNQGIGNLRENLDLLQKAANYLQSHQDHSS
jgi:hypothetical protein